MTDRLSLIYFLEKKYSKNILIVIFIFLYVCHYNKTLHVLYVFYVCAV